MYIKENSHEQLSNSQKTAELAHALMNMRQPEEMHKEYFYCIGLNMTNHVKIVDLISIGTINQTNVYIREIAKTLILKDCVSCILVHNHPSGNTNHSHDDKLVTERISKAIDLFEIKLLDHIIVVPNGSYYSFREMGDL